jgi:tripartite-type tricarboxylate transporter receptor subunit TctC
MLRKVMVILCIVLVAAFGLVGCSNSTSTAAKAPSDSNAPGKIKFPERSLEIMVPYSTGSSVDTNARAIAPSLERALNATVLVNNKAGASAGLGSNYVAKAKPDGYTLGLANIASIIATATMSDVGFDPVKDLKYIGCTATDVFIIAVQSNSPYNTLGDVVAYLKKNPHGLKFGASGPLSMDAMLAYNIEAIAGVDLNIVPFNGAGDTTTALLGGHIDLYSCAYSEVKNLLKDGKVKLIGVGGDQRIADQPNVPTFAEQGFPTVFNGAKRAIYIPSNTDPAVVTVLEEAIKKAVADPDFIAKCSVTGLVPQYLSAEDCQKEAQDVYNWFQANKDKIKVDK